MSFKGTHSALITAYQGLGLGLPTAYEGVSFTPPAAEDWAAVFVLPAVNDPVTLGEGGEDESEGILQIDFNTVEGESTSALLGYADAVQAGMVAGQGFTYGTDTVLIRSVDMSPIRADDGWLRISMNVNWYARYERPAF